jgi:hypothetical protein
LAGATLYAVSNVGQEYLVKAHDKYEFLAMLGSFGTLINGAQLLILERDELAAVVWTPAVVACWAGFTISLFAMYVLTSFFLQRADATLFNLSLLSSDLWAVVAALWLFSAKLSALYFVALALIVAGLVIYNSARDVGVGEQLPASSGSASDGRAELPPSAAVVGTGEAEPASSAAFAAAPAPPQAATRVMQQQLLAAAT